MNQKLQCNVRLANAMKEASHQCEMLTQLFLNDRAILLEDGAIWIKIRIAFNGTEAWVLKAQFDEISETQYSMPALGICDIITGQHANVSYSLPGTFSFEQTEGFHLIASNQLIRNEANMQRILLSFLDTPYMWGGITNNGIDCSGLSLMLYRYVGIPLTSFAAEQFHQGEVLDFLQDATCGDLAFFENEDGVISHVGVLLNNKEIIHATEKAGRVVIDFIDQEGIVSKRNGKRTHSLRIIKRI